MATKYNIVIDQGTTYEAIIDIVNITNVSWNLADFSGRSAIKKHYASLANASNFVVTVNAESAEITLSLAPNATSNIAGGRYVYDVELYSGNVVYRILEGMVTIIPEVTKP